MTIKDFPYQLAQFSRDFDPYGFADDFDSLEDCAQAVSDLLASDPETLCRAISSMIAEAGSQDERRQGADLLTFARMRAMS